MRPGIDYPADYDGCPVCGNPDCFDEDCAAPEPDYEYEREMRREYNTPHDH